MMIKYFKCKQYSLVTLFVGITLIVSSTAQAQTTAHELSEAFRQAIHKVKPAVVSISAERKMALNNQKMQQMPDVLKPFFGEEFQHPRMNPKRDWQGSGVMISSDGLILTNNHVVASADKLTVTLDDGQEIDADMDSVKTDPASDIAIFKLKGDKTFPYAKLGDSDQLLVGDWVLAIGSPFGLSQSVSQGIVSAKGRTNDDVPIGGVRFFVKNYIQTTAAINPGNSGGPLINLDGEVIGINNAIQTAGVPGNLGIGFAIPSNLALKIVDNLKEYGKVKRGYIGVTLARDPNVIEYHRKKNNVSYGALVEQVLPDTPGQKAGLKSQDLIILFEGQKVRSGTHLINMVVSKDIGEKVDLTIIRKGEREKITMELAERPDDVTLVLSTSLAENLLGIQVETLTEEIVEKKKIDKELKGVIVTAVNPGGSAAQEGIVVNDVLTEINDIAIETVDDLEKVLADIQAKMIKDGDDEEIVLLRKYSPGKRFPEEWVAPKIHIDVKEINPQEE